MIDNLEVTSAKYIKSSYGDNNDHIDAVIDGEMMSVPVDSANRHYAAILEWVAEGNTIEEAD